MVIKLYVQLGSSPSRAAWMTLKHLNVPFELKTVDAIKGEHLEADFLKINPCHTLPVLDDDGYIIWESRAIQIYLGEKYGDGRYNSLYPKDVEKRGQVLSMLNADMGSLYKGISEWMFPQVLRQKPADDEQTEALEKQLSTMEKILSERRYVCGEALSLADLSVLASLTYPAEVLGFQYADRYPHLHQYIEKLKSQLPYYYECLEGMKVWRDLANPPAATAE